MYIVKIDDIIRTAKGQATSPILRGLLEDNQDFQLVIKIDDVIRESGKTITQISADTGIIRTTISDICKCKRVSISYTHILGLAIYFGITDISQLIEIRRVE